MVDILSAINIAAKNMISLDSHAAKQLPLEEKLLYLQGLALIMNADQEIHEEEKEYLKVLIRSFEIDESVIDALEEFSLNPDQETIQSILKTFTQKNISSAFLFDMFMVANIDGKISEKEFLVISSFSNHLKIKNELLSYVSYLFETPKVNLNIKKFKVDFKFDFKYYHHVLSYFNINDADFNDWVLSMELLSEEISNSYFVNQINNLYFDNKVYLKNYNQIVIDGFLISLNSFFIDYDSNADMFFVEDVMVIKDKSIIDLINRMVNA